MGSPGNGMKGRAPRLGGGDAGARGLRGGKVDSRQLRDAGRHPCLPRRPPVRVSRSAPRLSMPQEKAAPRAARSACFFRSDQTRRSLGRSGRPELKAEGERREDFPIPLYRRADAPVDAKASAPRRGGRPPIADGRSADVPAVAPRPRVEAPGQARGGGERGAGRGEGVTAVLGRGRGGMPGGGLAGKPPGSLTSPRRSARGRIRCRRGRGPRSSRVFRRRWRG